MICVKSIQPIKHIEHNTQHTMDARTQRRLKREAVREVDYTEFVKERTHKKNIAAREKRMLRRRVLRDKYMKNEELKKKDKLRTKNTTEEEFLVSIPIYDIRKILRQKEIPRPPQGCPLAEINYQLWKIQKICEKYIK